MLHATLPDYFHEFQGELFDTRRDNWTAQPVRRNYARHSRDIKTGADLRACLRAGDYAFPGGYSIVYFTSDGAALCPSCVREELENVIDSIRTKCNDGWRVQYCDATCNMDEAPDCEHCNKEI